MSVSACPGRQGVLDEEDAFIRLTHEQRVEALSALDYSKQIGFYLYVASHSHPPDYSLRNVLASRGKDMLQPIMARLTSDIDDEGVYALFLIIDAMAPTYYDLRADTATTLALARSLDDRPQSTSICYSRRALMRATGDRAAIGPCL